MEGKILFSRHVLDEIAKGDFATTYGWLGDEPYIISPDRCDYKSDVEDHQKRFDETFSLYAYRKGYIWNRHWGVVLNRGHDMIEVSFEEAQELGEAYKAALVVTEERKAVKRAREKERLERRRWWP